MHSRNRGTMFITIEATMPKITDPGLLNRLDQLKEDIIRGHIG